jgi:hypothetical protein
MCDGSATFLKKPFLTQNIQSVPKYENNCAIAIKGWTAGGLRASGNIYSSCQRRTGLCHCRERSLERLPSHFCRPHNGDLDVVAANVTLDGSNFEFTATMNAVLGLTPDAVYVFGINRGRGKAKFGNIAAGDVLFDSTFVINQNAVGVVNDLINHTSTTISGVGAVKLVGFTISGVIPVSDLPSEGFSPSEYQYNIWPELGAPNPRRSRTSRLTTLTPL